jgi:arginine utilization protein RocB
MSLYEEIEALTLELVNISSVNGTMGEGKISNHIVKYLKDIEYFKTHPELIWEVPLTEDRYGRKNVFALLKGERSGSPATVILHGHVDTVGVEDYGNLKEYAFDPIGLERKLKDMDFSEEVKKDLESGDWMFGRGTNDMKSGLASHLVVLKEMSKKVKQSRGNVLLMANPVEENQHTGVIEALPFLKTLKKKERLEYSLAINNDYMFPLYSGDPKKYIYLGTIGKLLPCFYIAGKETHVGQCFEGLDPNLIGAELIRMISYHSDLSDEFEGKWTLPPVALKFTDLKTTYNVQTPIASFLYFNYFTYHRSPGEVLSKLKKIAEKAFRRVIKNVDREYRRYCSRAGLNHTPMGWKPKIMTYEELYAEIEEALGDQLPFILDSLVTELLRTEMDPRLICLRIVEELKKFRRETDPVIVLFFAPPYCPHNTLKGETRREKELIHLLEDVTEEMALRTGEPFEVQRFFPGLSDSCYLKMADSKKAIRSLIPNLPGWGKLYTVPVKEIQDLNIPAINFGPYGKDAHKWTERVNKPYTFSVLPEMTLLTIERIISPQS